MFFLMLSAGTVSGQDHPSHPVDGAGGHFVLAAANAAVAGMTAGLLHQARGGSFRDAFIPGAAGGVLVYAGKVVAVQRTHGDILAGRQVAAIGASISRNAADGLPPFSRVTLPFGPVRLHIQTGGRVHAYFSVDLLGAAALGTALIVYDAEIDYHASLGAGAPVLLVRDERRRWHGRHLAGTLLIGNPRDFPYAGDYPEVIAHEAVHLLQYDHAQLLWGEPFDRVLFEGWFPGRSLGRHFHLGIHSLATAGLRLLPERLNPVEIEAHFLAETWEYRPGQ